MPPSELGSFLQRHREEQGLSLDDVEAQTHIRRRLLEAIEAGEWGDLPPGVYTRGLLRNFARAVGVSPASALRMYIKERPSEARVPEPELLSQPLVQQPRLSFELVAALGLLAVAVALFAWMVSSLLLPAVQRSGIDLASNPGVPTAPVAPLESPTPSRPTPTPVRVSRAVPIGIDDATDSAAASGTTAAGTAPAASGSGGGEPTSTPRPTARGGGAAPSTAAPATPATAGKLALSVTATSDAWLMVRADGQQVFLDLLRKGESRRWTAKERFRVRTGNAGGTSISLNGRSVPSLGAAGEVVEREWRLLPDGNIEQSN